ncbi:hypothetical protein [Alcanivorax sp.]|uniref:hypothetical protein n=2 Tax=unclassified Alcanivorax TaxID=2638842 RepID=UPI002352C2DC|nr:hypothetical protein [Alcanivorax sp.]
MGDAKNGVITEATKKMRELIDAVDSRIKAPYFGYAALAFVALNWRGIFLLSTTEASPLERLSAFDSQTNSFTLVILPLLVGAAVAATSHWVHFIFGFISSKPSALIDNLYLEAEHKRTIRQTELEQSRSELFAVKEKELIERAQRDEKVAGIEDKIAKENLIAQLGALRNERDQLSAQIDTQKRDEKSIIKGLSSEASSILKAASKSKDGTIIKSESLGLPSIEAGGLTFGAKSHRDFAKNEAALEELVSEDFVKASGNQGVMFILTHRGWQAADKL